MNVLAVEPGMAPYEKEINGLKDMRAADIVIVIARRNRGAAAGAEGEKKLQRLFQGQNLDRKWDALWRKSKKCCRRISHRKRKKM